MLAVHHDGDDDIIKLSRKDLPGAMEDRDEW